MDGVFVSVEFNFKNLKLWFHEKKIILNYFLFSLDEMSPQYLGSDALPSTHLGCWTGWNHPGTIGYIGKSAICLLYWLLYFVLSTIFLFPFFQLCNIVTSITAISMSAVSTNGQIKGGGKKNPIYCYFFLNNFNFKRFIIVYIYRKLTVINIFSI